MTQQVDVPFDADQLEIALEAYTTVRLYSATDPAGTFDEVDTQTLDEDELVYTFVDDNGTPDTYYRYDLFNATTSAASALSEIWRPRGTTLRTLRLETARECAMGFEGTCSSEGTTTTLVDVLLADVGIDDKFLGSAWVYRPDAAEEDQVRRLAAVPFDANTGALTATRAWANAPESGEVYHVYSMYPPIRRPGIPYSWQEAVNDGLRMCWYVDQIDLGKGPGSRFSLSEFLGNVELEQIRTVWRRTILNEGTDDEEKVDQDADKEGRFWYPIENGPQDIDIFVSPASISSESIVVEVERRPNPLYTDTDVTDVPLERAKAAAKVKLYEFLNGASTTRGQYADELAQALREWEGENHNYRHDAVIKGL